MKKIMFFVLILEMAGIIAANVICANRTAELSAVTIEVPEGLELTINKDISVEIQDGSILIPEDTVIHPDYIFPDSSVVFHYEGTTERLHTDWDNIKEQNKLKELKNEAELKQQKQQKSTKNRAIFIGFAEGSAWLVFGSFLSLVLIKKDKKAVLIICHIQAIAAIAAILYIQAAYLCK
ncbi:MAG: hypothetical protein K5875_08310 [Saccharofermentans sp.]|nr:hypothetical protein [Saccharofermentans sp.]